ncbi:MAG: hypothetical protein D6679_12635 [Candidatus Hydrogenedentota bacterium]|nr:MAG: hypothetical protein D6679_12635 [Candidatus Hydrogenedentota bacterium]
MKGLRRSRCSVLLRGVLFVLLSLAIMAMMTIRRSPVALAASSTAAALATPIAVAIPGAHAASGAAAPVATDRLFRLDIPEPLQPWTGWVLHDHAQRFCPVASTDGETTSCVWISSVSIDAARSGAAFRQKVTVYAPSWVAVPGEERSWPLELKANGKPFPVQGRAGHPAVFLEPGRYDIAGRLEWKTRPASLLLPSSCALVSLRLDGRPVRAVNRTADGRIWFGESRAPARESVNTLRVRVFRKLRDGVPMLLETELRLAVSGSEREVRLGRMLPEGAVPVAFQSPLPARIDPDGRIRIQVASGEWTIHLTARFPDATEIFRMERMDSGWPENEIWVFQADQNLRKVTLSGAVAVDPEQTMLPAEWKHFPAYLMTPPTRLRLTETQRGRPARAVDDITLRRTFWLDFDGRGYTVRDDFSGRIGAARWLAAHSGYDIGRVELNGEPRLVTWRPETKEQGVEVRQGSLKMTAVSRLERRGGFPVTGWKSDCSKLSVTLNLPPGWSLFHARGADKVTGGWIDRWTLWDIFLVLVIAAALGKIINRFWGIVALVTLGLILHQQWAPRYLWLSLAATLALLKVLPPGRFRGFVRLYHLVTLLVLLLVALNFGVDQIRQGLYPQLERPVSERYGLSEVVRTETMGRNQAALSSALYGGASMEDKLKQAVPSPYRPAKLKDRFKDFDITAKIQTGPGLPEWRWRRVRLDWNGPVTAKQRLRLLLIPPSAGRLLRFLRAGLLFLLTAALLLYTLGGEKRWPALRRWRIPGHLAAALLLPLLLFAAAPRANAATDGFPPEKLLKELEERLTERPPVFPDAAVVSRGMLRAVGDRLVIRLQVDAATECAVPLPAGVDAWLPESVRVDGAPGVTRRGAKNLLWVVVPRGVHEVLLEGRITGDEVRLPFLLPAHNLTAVAPQWTVRGVVDGRVPGKSVRLNRRRRRARAEKEILPAPIPAFVRVERTIVLGLDWRVRTTVRRVAPRDGAIEVAIPLLPNASVVTSNVKVENSVVKVTLPPGVRTFEWESLVPKLKEPLRLRAPDSSAEWVEQWRLDASPLWHFECFGIPPVNAEPGAAGPVWRPWPGETVAIFITKPKAVEGATHTVESVELRSRPGKRLTENTLTLKLRASQGDEFAVRLEPGSDIRSVTLGGRALIVPKNADSVVLPLRPGILEAKIVWRRSSACGIVTRTPRVDLGEPAVNTTLILEVPRDRWVLAVAGPRLGPAVLYWSILVVVLAVSFGLGYWREPPLRAYQWALLLVGTSTINGVGGILMVLWFLVFSLRKRYAANLRGTPMGFVQIGLALLTLAAVAGLLASIPMSLLSSPEMHVMGYGSSSHLLKWYQDRTAGVLPTGTAVSLPITAYRLAMLAWSLWMVFALMKWIRWGWECFSAGGLWPTRRK